MKNRILLIFVYSLLTAEITAQVLGRSFEPPIPENLIRAILNEASGENAYAHTRYLSSFARYPNSSGFHRAAEYIAETAQKSGLANVKIEAFPAKEASWDYIRATLSMTSPVHEKLADTDPIGVSLCNNSNDAEVEAELVEVGSGTSDLDYEGKDVKGKIVLTSGNPYAAQKKAIFERGALGLVSYFSNSFFGIAPSRNVVSWTGIRATTDDGKPAGFGFMLSPNAGARLSERLKSGEKIKVHALVRVKTETPGKIEMVTAEIPGSNPNHDDVVFSAHLDHQPPGANDNASGSATLLEIARTVQTLVQNGAMPQPRRTLRFWWVTEIQGTYLYFYHHPEEAQKIAFNINIDQAGGDKHYRNDLVYIKSPPWLPNFANEAFDLLCEYMQTHYADVYHAPSALFVAATGRQDEPLTYRGWKYAELTDHIVFEDAAINIPSISFAYPSFNYIHTSDDGIEHIDATTLKRSVFFGTAMGLYLASPRKGERTQFESEVAARLSAEAMRAWGSAFDLLSSSNKESIHQDYLRAVAIAGTGVEVADLALASFGRLGRPNPDTDRLFSVRPNIERLRSSYQKRCQQLGVKANQADMPKDGERYSKIIPHRKIALGSNYDQWLAFETPGLSVEVSSELKNFVDGKRSVTDIWQYLVSEYPIVTFNQVVSTLDSLQHKGWVVLK